MLTAYRRHTARCKKRRQEKGLAPLRPDEIKLCACPFWAIGNNDRGEYTRCSLGTRDPANAREKLANLERGEPLIVPAEHIAIGDAFDRARAILATQKGVKPQSLDANQGTLQRLIQEYAATKGYRFLKEITPADLDALIGDWTEIAPSTRRIRISILRSFFEMAAGRKWIEEDPSINVIMPRGGAEGQTKPFSAEEDRAILAVIPYWQRSIRSRGRQSAWSANPRTASALLLLLRHIGLRISDAFVFDPRSLEAREIDDQRVYCYYAPRQKKTDHPVFLPLRPTVAEQIISAPRLCERYAFSDGSATKK
jgi:hypothetical protein